MRVAVACGYCSSEQAEGARLLVERVIGILWKLTRPGPAGTLACASSHVNTVAAAVPEN